MTRPGLACSSPGLCRTCRETTEVSSSGEGNEIQVAIVPQVLIGVRQQQDTLGVKCRDSAGIVRDEDDGALVVTQGREDLFSRSGVEVVGRFVEQQDVCARDDECC